MNKKTNDVLCWNDMSEEEKSNFLYDLSHQKEEPVSEELEEATNAYISNENNYSHSRTDTFKAGAEWQKEHHQAEKDLALTWEDIKTIDRLLNKCVDCSNPYQEVLNRFNKYKEDGRI